MAAIEKKDDFMGVAVQDEDITSTMPSIQERNEITLVQCSSKAPKRKPWSGSSITELWYVSDVHQLHPRSLDGPPTALHHLLP